MTESMNDILRRNHCKTPEWIADLEMPCFDLEIQEFLEEHALFKSFATHCFHKIFQVACLSIQIIFKGSFQSCNKSLINQACSGPYWENIGLRSFLYGPSAARLIFSQYGPRAWYIRYMYCRLTFPAFESFGFHHLGGLRTLGSPYPSSVSVSSFLVLRCHNKMCTRDTVIMDMFRT